MGEVTMVPLRLGLIGIGAMGSEHLQTEHGLIEEVCFTALCDTNRMILEQKGRALGLPTFTDYHELINSGLCEAILIATPPHLHAPVAIFAAERGLHVLCEKPLAICVSEADAMLTVARKHNTVLGVMFQTRLDPLYQKVRQLLVSGEIGQLYRTGIIASGLFRPQSYYNNGAWRGTWRSEGGGILMNQAPQFLDILVWLGGMPRCVTARTFNRAHKIEAEDTVDALLDYGDGYTGYLYTTTAQWPGQSRLEFCGENGQLVIEDGRLRLFKLSRGLSYEVQNRLAFTYPKGAWKEISVDRTKIGGHADVVRNFACNIREDVPLVADGVDGLRSLELANALLLSGFTGQSVSLPLDRIIYAAFLKKKRAEYRQSEQCY